MKIVSKSMLGPGEEPPKIEFPCDYPIKVLGDADETFVADVVAVVRRHAPEVTERNAQLKKSSKGRFASATVIIVATGEAQLKALFDDLKKLPSVKMVL